jgi:phage terminase small subunit
MAKAPSGKKPAPKKPAPIITKKPAAPKKPAGSRTPVSAKAAPKKPTKAPAKKTAKPAKTAPAPTPQEPAQLGLTLKQQRFVDEYMVDLNATQAAIRAGYSADTAGAIGHENLKKPEIQLAIAEARKAQQERTHITADRWLLEVALIALADARELVEVKKGCCRNCYGEGHKYQRTVGEMNRDREAWREKGKNPAEFDEAGGIGFNPLLAPHPECPHCGGDGHARTILKDTRYLSPAAAALYAGAKETQYGIEVKMHSKHDALEKLAKHLGTYEKDNQQKTDPLSSLLQRIAGGNGNGFAPVPVDPERPTSFEPKPNSQDDES